MGGDDGSLISFNCARAFAASRCCALVSVSDPPPHPPSPLTETATVRGQAWASQTPKLAQLPLTSAVGLPIIYIGSVFAPLRVAFCPELRARSVFPTPEDRMSHLSPILLHLLTVACRLRACGHCWEQIALQVHRSPNTCRQWPE